MTKRTIYRCALGLIGLVVGPVFASATPPASSTRAPASAVSTTPPGATHAVTYHPVAAHVLAPPPHDELPPARVQAALEDYRRWLDHLAEHDTVAGLATAVVVDDKVVFEHTLGYADAATHAPVTPDTVFRLASLSKAFATGITSILVDQGKLSWDTRLSSVLPYFKLKNSTASQEATVADILGQRLGLPHNTYDNLLEDNVPYESLIRKLDEVSMICPVGQCYGYQNVAFSLIGDVIYARTGQFFYHLVYQRIFGPLGMTDASYGSAALESSKSWARPHFASRHGWVPFLPKEAYYRVAPAAGVNASIRDMEKWLLAQMGDRPDVLDPKQLAIMHHPDVPTPTEMYATPWRRARLTSAHYGLGWRVFTYAGQTLIYHAGAVEGYRSMIGFFPRYHVGIVTLWNSPGATPANLMPMLFDEMLGLPHVDWAGVEGGAEYAALRPRHRRGRAVAAESVAARRDVARREAVTSSSKQHRHHRKAATASRATKSKSSIAKKDAKASKRHGKVTRKRRHTHPATDSD